MRIKEALKYGLLNGLDSTVIRQKIAARLWSKSSEVTREVNVSNLVRGQTNKKIDNLVTTICEETGVSPDFLFGYDMETKTFSHE
jgi:hypothetical protein